MHRQKSCYLAALLGLYLGSCGLAIADNLPTVKTLFEMAARDVTSKSAVAVYVPVSLQNLDADAKDGCAFANIDHGGFSIALYGRVTEIGKAEPLPCEASNAAFIAEIHGDSKPMPDLSKRRSAQKVTLANGFAGWFLPVSCGGSCGPATLYWQAPKASYWLQIRFNSVVPVTRQLKVMQNTANSVELVPGGR
jgi:hypothetical protein